MWSTAVNQKMVVKEEEVRDPMVKTEGDPMVKTEEVGSDRKRSRRTAVKSAPAERPDLESAASSSAVSSGDLLEVQLASTYEEILRTKAELSLASAESECEEGFVELAEPVL